MGRFGVEMEGGQFGSEHSLSKGSEVRTGRARLEKDEQTRHAGAHMCDVEGRDDMVGKAGRRQSGRDQTLR